jgi:hypothetical protein
MNICVILWYENLLEGNLEVAEYVKINHREIGYEWD